MCLNLFCSCLKCLEVIQLIDGFDACIRQFEVFVQKCFVVDQTISLNNISDSVYCVAIF